MKKTSLALALIIIAFSCPAQNLFGIFAGPQVTTAKYSVKDVKQPTQSKFGFQAGATLKVPFDVNLFFSPAIFYSLKGYKVNFNQYTYPPDTLAINNNTTIHTLEVAALLQFDFGNQPNHFFVKGGPSADFQVTGNEKYDLRSGGSVDRSMPFAFTAYGHYSVNFLLQFGYETKNGLIIFGQFNNGLTNINNADAGPMIKHRAFGISIGKYLNLKKS